MRTKEHLITITIDIYCFLMCDYFVPNSINYLNYHQTNCIKDIVCLLYLLCSL